MPQDGIVRTSAPARPASNGIADAICAGERASEATRATGRGGRTARSGSPLIGARWGRDGDANNSVAHRATDQRFGLTSAQVSCFGLQNGPLPGGRKILNRGASREPRSVALPGRLFVNGAGHLPGRFHSRSAGQSVGQPGALRPRGRGPRGPADRRQISTTTTHRVGPLLPRAGWLS